MSARRPRAEFLGLAGYSFLTWLRRGAFYTFLLIFLREELGLPATAAALIGAVNAAASMLGQNLVWGRRSDRSDRRAALMIRGEAIAGLGYLATGALFVVSVGRLPPGLVLLQLVVCLGTLEFFWSMTDVGYQAAVAQVTEVRTRGRYVGSVELLGMAGIGAGLLLAGEVYRGGAGFTGGLLWVLAAGFILAGVPLVAVTLRHLDGVSATLERPTAAPLTPRFRRYLGTLAVAVLGLWCFQQNHSYFVRLDSVAGAGDGDLARIRMVFWVAMAITGPIAGWMVDRVGSRRGFAAALGLAALVPLSFLPTGSVAFAALTMALFGAALSAFRTAGFALAAELTPDDRRGRHFAAWNAVMALGWGMAALFVGGPVADLVIVGGGSARAGYGASFVVGSALALAALARFVSYRGR